MRDYLVVDLSRSSIERDGCLSIVEFRDGEIVQLHTYNQGLLYGREMASAIDWECERTGITKVVLDPNGLGLLLKECLSSEFDWLDIVEIDIVRARQNFGSIYDEIMDIKSLDYIIPLKRNLQNHVNFKVLFQQIDNLSIKQLSNLKLSLVPKDHTIDMGMLWCIAYGMMYQMGFVKQ